jgi:zinc protease
MRRMVFALVLAALPAAGAPFDQSGIADWTQVPPAGPEPTFVPPTPVRSKLANGMALLVVENHKLPIVAMTLVVPGAGAAGDPVGKGGLAGFTADLLDEGAGDLTAIQIAEESDRLGASIGVAAGVDHAQMSVQTLAKTLEPTLDLVTNIVAHPTFDAADVSRVNADRVVSLEQRRDRPREVAQVVLAGTLYGRTTAYGHPVNGTRDEVASLTRDDVQAFYKAHWNPSAMTLIVVGDVDPKALRARLDAGLGAWKVTGAKKPARVVAKGEKLAHRLFVVDRKDAAQSDVRIGIIGMDRKDKRYYAFDVLTTTLGGGFTSRLTQRLREQLGITYGARATMDWRLAPGPFSIGTAIVTPSTGQGISETLKIVDDLATNDIPAAELEKSKQNLIRALPAQFDTNAATAGSLADLALNGLPDNWYASYAAQIRKVTAKDVKAAAKAVIPSQKLAVVVVGDVAKIGADLEKLGLGEPAMFDLYGAPIAK